MDQVSSEVKGWVQQQMFPSYLSSWVKLKHTRGPSLPSSLPHANVTHLENA